MTSLITALERQVNKRTSNFDNAYLNHLAGVLKDREVLKRTSKGYEATALAVELETTTLGLLEAEMRNTFGDGDEKADLLEFEVEDKVSFLEQIEEQQKRVAKKPAVRFIFVALSSGSLLQSDHL